MENFKLNLQHLEGAEVLTKNQMRMVIGGVRQVYQCTCTGGSGGQWIYQSGERPSDNKLSTDIADACSTSQATCIYANYPDRPPVPLD